MQKANVTDVI